MVALLSLLPASALMSALLFVDMVASFQYSYKTDLRRPQTRRQRSLSEYSSFPRTAAVTKAVESSSIDGDELSPSRRVVVVGGGWAGFSAADALSTSEDVRVDLLDASPRGAGGLAGGWTSPKLGRNVEVGIHGFWREYRNTFAALDRIGLDVDYILTPYTPSVLVSESGRVATAPVLGVDEKALPKKLSDMDWTNPTKLVENVAALLPPPLDVALLSDFESKSLTAADRLSAIGLLGAWADFGQEDPDSWKLYDDISAERLFLSLAGLSPILYRELVTPLLHVLPMCPGYDCSAAAALSCFHVFALQARGAFDVRWCRGTISEKIFNPWATKLTDTGRVTIRGSSRVTSINQNSKDGKFLVVVNEKETISCDAVVLAVGATAMKRNILPSSPPLQALPISATWNENRGVTCVAVRLFLKPSRVTTAGLGGGRYDSTQLPPAVASAMTNSPVVVCGPRVGKIPELGETGFCIYDLQRLQDEFAVSSTARRNEQEPVAVLEVDFFRANTIADMENDMDVAKLALKTVAAALDTEEIPLDSVLDVSVVRARDAVSHFCVGSASSSPPVNLEQGLYICGDWIDRTGHASWSTEKAVVTGRQAAACLATDFGLVCETDTIPAASDSEQLALLRRVSRTVKDIVPGLKGNIPVAPWILARQLGSFRSSQ